MDDSTGDSGLNTTGIWNQTLLLHIHETEICNTPSSRNTTVAEYVACLIASVTIVENCVILGAIFRGNRSVRKPPYWFIANLAVADALTGLGVILAVFLPIGSGPSSRIGLKVMSPVAVAYLVLYTLGNGSPVKWKIRNHYCAVSSACKPGHFPEGQRLE